MVYMNQSSVSYILLVDDDHDDHFLLREAFTRQVPQSLIESVYDGDEALQYLDSCLILPDLIVLDLNMPKLSGYDTLRRIRADLRLINIPIVIYSTSRKGIDRELTIAAGANAFYCKANTQHSLQSVVKELSEKWLSRSLA